MEKILYPLFMFILTILVGAIAYFLKDFKNTVMNALKEIQDFIKETIKDISRHKEKFEDIEKHNQDVTRRLTDYGARLINLELDVKSIQVKCNEAHK